MTKDMHKIISNEKQDAKLNTKHDSHFEYWQMCICTPTNIHTHVFEGRKCGKEMSKNVNSDFCLGDGVTIIFSIIFIFIKKN